ncbi:hypothetical protein F1880_008859 [Penicillium rolfsii]|nr:hypothetical protein F1880_008859 [Penicillium rolfsii]
MDSLDRPSRQGNRTLDSKRTPLSALFPRRLGRNCGAQSITWFPEASSDGGEAHTSRRQPLAATDGLLGLRVMGVLAVQAIRKIHQKSFFGAGSRIKRSWRRREMGRCLTSLRHGRKKRAILRRR